MNQHRKAEAKAARRRKRIARRDAQVFPGVVREMDGPPGPGVQMPGSGLPPVAVARPDAAA